MPKHRCSICGVGFKTEAQAKACEDLGSPGEHLFKPGDVFGSDKDIIIVKLSIRPYVLPHRHHVLGYEVRDHGSKRWISQRVLEISTRILQQGEVSK